MKNGYSGGRFRLLKGETELKGTETKLNSRENELTKGETELIDREIKLMGGDVGSELNGMHLVGAVEEWS